MVILNWVVLLKGNKLSDKCKLILFYPPSTNSLFPYYLIFCKLFLFTSKPIHALLASKRRLIDLQKVPFKRLTNALLKSN